MSINTTAEDIAKWMLGQIKPNRPLYQEDAAWEIKKRYGGAFVYDNENGNPAIEKTVLDAFRKLSGDSIVWSRGERCWRRRERADTKGRQQD